MESVRIDDRPLDAQECIELLGTTALGRVLVQRRGLPCIVPVSYRVAGDTLVFHCDFDTARSLLGGVAVVAFEVDNLGPTGGWIVNVVGSPRPLVDDHPATQHLAPVSDPWIAAGADEVRLVAISLDVVHGRRFRLRGWDEPVPAAAATPTVDLRHRLN